MKKILITGGSGTVGSSFIKEYYQDYKFFNFSRNEEHISELAQKYPKVTNIIGDICDLDKLTNTFESIKPDIVIHAAAMKHVDLVELNPTRAIEININGSLNVIKASIRSKVPLTVGVSTDKACSPENIYGYTKRIMENMFMEHYNSKTRFVCTRFANVAGSKGSVIPFFKRLVENNLPLKLTSPDMNRLMFSKQECAQLIHNAIDYSNEFKKGFILSPKIKSINMLKLAQTMSDNIEIVGLRPGEKLNEDLISQKELPYTKIVDNHIFLFREKQPPSDNLKIPCSSLNSDFMNNEEILKLISQ
jgi:UDP-N-acetylglucosamine 4,6-dehydratase